MHISAFVKERGGPPPEHRQRAQEASDGGQHAERTSQHDGGSPGKRLAACRVQGGQQAGLRLRPPDQPIEPGGACHGHHFTGLPDEQPGGLDSAPVRAAHGKPVPVAIGQPGLAFDRLHDAGRHRVRQDPALGVGDDDQGAVAAIRVIDEVSQQPVALEPPGSGDDPIHLARTHQGLCEHNHRFVRYPARQWLGNHRSSLRQRALEVGAVGDRHRRLSHTLRVGEAQDPAISRGQDNVGEHAPQHRLLGHEGRAPRVVLQGRLVECRCGVRQSPLPLHHPLRQDGGRALNLPQLTVGLCGQRVALGLVHQHQRGGPDAQSQGCHGAERDTHLDRAHGLGQRHQDAVHLGSGRNWGMPPYRHKRAGNEGLVGLPRSCAQAWVATITE